MNIEDGLFYYWNTDESHYDNNETMYDFLNFELSENIEVTHEDGSPYNYIARKSEEEIERDAYHPVC